MGDLIWGNIKNILGLDTFELNVTHKKDDNQNQYADVEKIKFQETDIVSIPVDVSQRSKEDLEHNLKDKFVKCEIEGKDSSGYLIARVFQSGQGGY